MLKDQFDSGMFRFVLYAVHYNWRYYVRRTNRFYSYQFASWGCANSIGRITCCVCYCTHFISLTIITYNRKTIMTLFTQITFWALIGLFVAYGIMGILMYIQIHRLQRDVAKTKELIQAFKRAASRSIS